MRNVLIGATLAALFVAALFAAARFGEHKAQVRSEASPRSPSQIAAQIAPAFVGTRQIGHWTLACGQVHELPRAPGQTGQGPANSQGTPPRSEGAPPNFRIPRCRVLLGLKNPHRPVEQIRITFRQFGFKRALAVFVRIPPAEASSGDTATLRFDKAERPMTIGACAKEFCLAINSIRRPEEAALLNSRQIMLVFTPRTTGQQVALPVPTDGLPEAVAAMKRIDT